MGESEPNAKHGDDAYHLGSGGHYSRTPQPMARPSSPPGVGEFIVESLDGLDDALRESSGMSHQRQSMIIAKLLAHVDPVASAAIARCCIPIRINAVLAIGEFAIEGSRVPCGRRDCPICSFHVGDDNVREFRERFLAAFDQGCEVEALILTTGEVGITDPSVAKFQLATLIVLLQGLFHERHEHREYGLVSAMEPAIDQDGLFRPHVHVLAFGRKGFAKRLAQDWNQRVMSASSSPRFVGEARVCEGAFDREQLQLELQARRVPKRLSYHLKLGRLKSFRNASPAAIKSFVRSVPEFKGTQMLRAFGGFRRSGVGRGIKKSGSANGGMPRASQRRPQPALTDPRQYKPNPSTQGHAQPSTPANNNAVGSPTAAQRKPVELSPILSVLLNRWYAGTVDLEPKSDPHELRRIPQYVGLLPDLARCAKHAMDWRVALAAAVFVRAAARLISKTILTTSTGTYTENLSRDEIRMLRLAGFDPSLPPAFPFDETEFT